MSLLYKDVNLRFGPRCNVLEIHVYAELNTKVIVDTRGIFS